MLLVMLRACPKQGIQKSCTVCSGEVELCCPLLLQKRSVRGTHPLQKGCFLSVPEFYHQEAVTRIAAP